MDVLAILVLIAVLAIVLVGEFVLLVRQGSVLALISKQHAEIEALHADVLAAVRQRDAARTVSEDALDVADSAIRALHVDRQQHGG